MTRFRRTSTHPARKPPRFSRRLQGAALPLLTSALLLALTGCAGSMQPLPDVQAVPPKVYRSLLQEVQWTCSRPHTGEREYTDCLTAYIENLELSDQYHRDGLAECSGALLIVGESADETRHFSMSDLRKALRLEDVVRGMEERYWTR